MSALKKMDESKPSKYQFEKLSLTEDIDISVYQDAIDFAFSNPDVKNIAISGAYGSGKSSVLASYKKKKPDKKFVHISLAHFVPEKKQNISIPTQNDIPINKTDTVALEGKILNQLIHQLDVRNIPQTNFRVKNTISPKFVVRNSVAIIAFIVCFLHLILSYTWIDFVSTFEAAGLRSFLEWFTTPISFLLSGLIIFIICVIYIYSAVKAQRYNAAIRKFSLQGNEIELFEEKNDSFFDKYLNEVLYLFENSSIDAIVFEDMDRYEMEAIFERLREVNTLVNIRLSQKNKGIIRFIFLLRDDIFISKDRTKFFDFIIPIVPVIDSSNSYDQLIAHLERNSIRSDFSDEFLQGISLYIDDMRLLKNICNEYLIYHSRLGSIDLDPEKLLALITYKNIYPHDFGLLQNNLGYVHAVFTNRSAILKSQLTCLENEQKRLAALEEVAAENSLKSKLEVMRAYAVMHLSEYTYNLRNLSDSSLDAHLRRALSGSKLEEYETRIELVSSQKQDEIREARKEIEHKILSIRGMKLYEIIPHEDGAKVLLEITNTEEGVVQDYKDIKNSQYFDLLKYLILNGYLDESYPDYMTYFYPNSLTRTDKIFLRRVLDRSGHDYSYNLDNPRLVVSKLRVSDFDYVEVLNNNLLNYLLKDDINSEKLQHLLAQIEKRRHFHFLSQFLEITTERERFVQVLNGQWPGFFDEIISNGGLSPEEIRQYSVDTLYYCDDDMILRVNSSGRLAHYISTCPDYLKLSNPKIEKLIHAFALLHVQFQSLDYNVSHPAIFKQVYQASLYSLNMENINLMLTKIYEIADDNKKLISSNYSCICQFPESPLYHYIESHINDYMGMWLAMYSEIIEDLEEDAIRLLNNEKIFKQFKEKYIEQLGTTISDLQAVRDKELWELLLGKNLVLHMEKNAVAYWSFKNKLDSLFISYLNAFDNKIDFTSYKEVVSNTVLNDFFVDLVKCNGIHNRCYKDCVISLGFKWGDKFDIKGLSVDKVKILAKHHVLQMTPETLCFLRENYAGAVCMYIESNINEYISIMTTQLIDQQELLMILEWDIADELKKRLIDMAPSSISIKNNKYSPAISVYILQNKLDSSDIPVLYKTYDRQSGLIKDYIYVLATENIDSVIQEVIETSMELKDRILSSDQTTDFVKQKLLMAIIKELSQEDVLYYLCVAQKEEFVKIFNSKTRIRIENNMYNKEILDVFQNRGWISSYSLNKEGDKYTVQRTTLSKKKSLAQV